MTNLLGAWTLVSSINYRGDEPKPTFGEPPAGQIQYTADGRMSAFLMDPDWASRGDNNTIANSFTEFFSYGGTWERDGDQVCHTILYSSVPTKVGTQFERTIEVIDEDTIRLVTAPETSKSGTVYVTKLTWKRVKG